MADKKNNEKKTDKDFRPDQGQQSNENWDDENDRSGDNPRKQEEGSDKQTSEVSGNGNNQRSKDESDEPLDADFEELPDQKSMDRGSNLTGPGLG